MRTLGGLAAHVAQSSTTLSRCLRLDLHDGTIVALTDSNRRLSINLGDGAATYQPNGILPSAVSLSTGFEADNFEARGPLSALVTQAAILGGRFDRARARYFEVNRFAVGAGRIEVLGGYVTEARIEDRDFVMEVRSDADRYNQTVGEVLTPYCRADFGDARCKKVVVPDAATVTAVTDEITFRISGGVATDDHYNFGLVTFASGILLGTRPVEVFDYTAAGVVTLMQPLADLPEIGDTLTIQIGCDRTRAMCRDRHDNVLNYRGEPDAPGNDAYWRYPVPGSGSV